MALDFQQVREQVRQLGEHALERQHDLKSRQAQACELLEQNANEVEKLRQKVQSVVRNHDPSLRCALPVKEGLNAHFPLPPLPEQATVIAADGSQIFADRHAEAEYSLVNTGAIWMRYGSADAPSMSIQSRLLYDELMENMSEERLALERDLSERTRLAELAAEATAPVITFTDGPMELWIERGESAGEFQKSLEAYLQVLEKLHELKVTTAGYVDKPGADLVVRLLEVAKAEESDLAEMRKYRPFRGVTDIELYRDLLQPGERSAVFAVQSRSTRSYQGALALHFFYLNVGRPEHEWLARVEVPAWVMEDSAMLDNLHSVLVNQCQMIGTRPYPYLLHRAHETAVVNQEEKEQVTQMIVFELRNRGLEVAGASHKQSAKDLAGRTRYGG